MPSFLGHPRATTILLPAPVYATWNPAGTDGNITLSNGNLTAELTGSDGAAAARTQTGRDSGKYYVEFTINSIAVNPSALAIGLIDTGQIPNGELGDLQYGYAWRLDGVKEANGSSSPYGVPAENGAVIMMACKLYSEGGVDVADIYFGAEGAWFGGSNPASEFAPAFSAAPALLSTDFLVACTLKSMGDRLTANFGQSPFSFSVPSGYGAGWGDNVNPEA